jgi:exosome complex component RRP41
MAKKGAPEKLIIDGRRLDGRKLDEPRPIKIEAGVLSKADGSAYLEQGDTKVLAGVYGPRELHPRFLQDPERGRLIYRYSMEPYSVEERKRPGPDRRSVEVSKVSRKALESALILEEFPTAGIHIFVEILQADAGTRLAALNAASVALADAGIPMRDIVAGIAVGKVEGQLVLDLNSPEDNFGESDLPVAMLPRTGEITLLQLDGPFTTEELKEAFKLARKGIDVVYKTQKKALKERYKRC